jgi:methylmalonyl-CoA/ethylmalonyl-CoA epimerase
MDHNDNTIANRTGLEFKRAVQVGIVVKDLDHATRLLTELFGIGPFRFIEWPNRPESKYYFRGKEEQIKIRQAFTQVGHLELELIQPLEGEKNAYYEFLQQKGGGIHHILFEVENMDETILNLAGHQVEVLQAGTGIRPGTKWALMDTLALIGFLLEMRQVAPGCDGTSIPKDPA